MIIAFIDVLNKPACLYYCNNRADNIYPILTDFKIIS